MKNDYCGVALLFVSVRCRPTHNKTLTVLHQRESLVHHTCKVSPLPPQAGIDNCSLSDSLALAVRICVCASLCFVLDVLHVLNAQMQIW